MSFEVVDGFLDRERVDAEALKAALASEEGRQYLVDVVAIRELMADHPAAPAETVAAPSAKRRVGRGGSWAAAAAVVAALTGGFIAGRYTAPTADLEIRRASAADQTAPVPTSVIRFEPGVDWDEHVTRN